MDEGKKQRIIPKIVCVLLSLGLWLYITNVENPVRTVEVKNIPVELVNTDVLEKSKFSVVSDQKFTVDLKIEGTSNDVISVKKDDFKIVADMSTYALKEGENTIPVQILAYPENISVKNNGYLGIKVKLENFITKEIPIISNVQLSYNNHIYEKSKTISPSKVTVSGGKSQIEKISKAVLVGEEKNINGDFSKTYKIKFLDADGNELQDVKANESESKLSISVSKGKTVPVKVQTTGVITNGFALEKIELGTQYVKITGEDNALNSIKEINTEYIDLSNITEDKEMQAKLIIPEGITLKDSENTVRVKFKITKQSVENREIICNVQYVNLPEDFTIQNSTESVKVTLSGLKENLDSIKVENINAVVDLSQINQEGTFSYAPQVTILDSSSVTVGNVESADVTVSKKS